MEVGEITGCGFNVASADDAPFFQFGPQALNPATPPVGMKIIGDGAMDWIGWHYRFCAQGSDLIAPASRGIGSVTHALTGMHL